MAYLTRISRCNFSAPQRAELLSGPYTGPFVVPGGANGKGCSGNRVRVYFRYQGELCREPFNGDATPDNIAQAERLVGMIEYEIKAGTFSYAATSPTRPG